MSIIIIIERNIYGKIIGINQENIGTRNFNKNNIIIQKIYKRNDKYEKNIVVNDNGFWIKYKRICWI